MKEIDVLYDRYWKPTLRLIEYADSDYRLVDFLGNHIWFLKSFHNKNYHSSWWHMYDYEWKNVWFWGNGIMRDLEWNCVGFWERANDFPQPLLPVKWRKPQPRTVKTLVRKPYHKDMKFGCIKKFYWSKYEPLQLFNWKK